jgi:hypothetical protein
MKRMILGLIAALLVSVPASAQTYLTSTTLSAAVNASSSTFVVVSATGIAAGGGLYVDREFVTVRSVSGTTITVARGQSGTTATAHGSGRTVIIVPAAALSTVISNTDPTPFDGVGTCTASNHRYLPVINVTSGNVWLCRYTTAGQTATIWAATNVAAVTYNSLVLSLP